MGATAQTGTSQPADQPPADPQAVDGNVETASGDRGVPAQVVPRGTNDRGVPNSSAIGEAWLWVGILIVVTIAGGLALMWYRRRVLAAASTEGAEGFMETMRRMRASGEMSEEEFQAVRRNLVAGMSRGLRETNPSADRGRNAR